MHRSSMGNQIDTPTHKRFYTLPRITDIVIDALIMVIFALPLEIHLRELFSNAPDLSISPQLVDKIERVIGSYQYNQFSIINSSIEFGEKITIVGGYDFSNKDIKDGTCSELASKAFYEIQSDIQEFSPRSKYQLFVAFGNDDKFFSEVTAGHLFLVLVPNGDPLPDFSDANNQKEWLAKSGAIIIDPSNKLIQSTNRTAYKIKNTQPPQSGTKNIDIKNSRYIPIGITRSGSLVNFGCTLDGFHCTPMIKISSPDYKNNEIIGISWDGFDDLLKSDPMILATIRHIQTEYKKKTEVR